MHAANKKWLEFHRYTTLILQVPFILAFLYAAFTPDASGAIADTLRKATVVNVIIAITHVFHALISYSRLSEKKGNVVSSAVLQVLLLINISSLIYVSENTISGWLVLWFLAVAVSGALGFFSAIGTILLTTLYYTLNAVAIMQNPLAERSPVTLPETGVLVLTSAMSILSWLFFRRYYEKPTEQKIHQLTGQLTTREKLYDTLIQSIADGVIVTDTEGKISMMNSAAAKMTEWPIEEALSVEAKTVIKLSEEDGKPIPDHNHIFEQAAATQETKELVAQLAGRNSKKQIVSVIASPITLPETKEFAGVVAVIRDVSEARAEEARRADFISTASHEMRTPVAAIEGYLALALNDKVSKIDNSARSYLMKAHSSTQHLGKLFQDLLTSAKAEDGRLVSHPMVVEIGGFVQQLTDDLKFTAEKKGLLVDLIVGTDSPDKQNNAVTAGKVVKPLYYAMVDSDRFREVITNLFDNAVKYTEKGKITIGLTGNKDIVQIFIKDTGVGIPKEDIPHMFQKFYRVDNSATRTIGGTGLGLYICRKIIELYNGRVWVESEQGSGSTFYINLPRLSAQDAANAQKNENQTS